ncbi:MAG: MarR family winged helix-turn-helix transcriptional regulator [Beijerinckiaceae bacterium]
MSKKAAPTSLLRLEAFLPYRLNVIAATVSEGLARVYSDRFGITIPEWRVIATLGQFGQVTAKAIGLHSRMHKTKVSRAVAALDARELVQRLANPDDKREAFVSLTMAGEGIYRDILPLAEDYEARLLGVLNMQERADLDRLLNALAKEAETLLLR